MANRLKALVSAFRAANDAQQADQLFDAAHTCLASINPYLTRSSRNTVLMSKADLNLWSR
jgi:hypothetical protein